MRSRLRIFVIVTRIVKFHSELGQVRFLVANYKIKMCPYRVIPLLSRNLWWSPPHHLAEFKARQDQRSPVLEKLIKYNLGSALVCGKEWIAPARKVRPIVNLGHLPRLPLFACPPDE